jgi:hypothetical protein
MWRKVTSKYLLWALAGVAAVGLVWFVLWGGPWLFTQHPQQGLTAEQELKARNDVRTTLVQAVAGIAVASGAIITYRTFWNTRAEQDRAYVTDTYTKAVEQLGHDEAPVRLGALYSLVSLAQDNPPRRQIVVDVLCAYLRMPYTPPGQDESVTELGAQDAAQELQVRQTAQRLLADHLRCPPRISHEDAQRIKASPEKTFWPGISLDLTGAILVDFGLSDMSVIGASFTKATFSGVAWFNQATFSGAAWFERATFSGAAMFLGATFSDVAGFGGATFSDVAWFSGATFSSVAGFGGATFSSALFADATFSGAAGFDEATFSGTASFRGVRVLHLEDPGLNKGGEYARRVWPEGWTVRPDADDP